MTKNVLRRKILWKAEYIINVKEIDEEHQELFELAQKALEINEAKKDAEDNSQLKKVISKLLMNTKIHFTHEQNYMRTIKYPDFENHTKLHRRMIENITTLLKDLDSLSYLQVEDVLYDFMEEYFLNHIITEDKKIFLWGCPIDEIKNDFGWKDHYSVNNTFIDKDHKILFDIAQEALDMSNSPNRAEKIKNVIVKLYNYMKTHFENEEKYMRDIDYPKYEEHKELHDNIISCLNDFIRHIHNFKLEDFEKELAKVIDITLLQHIILEDRKITKYIQSIS